MGIYVERWFQTLMFTDNDIKYSAIFLEWLSKSIRENEIKSVVQIGLGNGYLSLLFLQRAKHMGLKYLGVGSIKDISELVSIDDISSFFQTETINNVETVGKVAMFLVFGGPSMVVCEEMQYGPLFYFPLLKPGDVMITYGQADLPGQNDITDGWKYYIK